MSCAEGAILGFSFVRVSTLAAHRQASKHAPGSMQILHTELLGHNLFVMQGKPHADTQQEGDPVWQADNAHVLHMVITMCCLACSHAPWAGEAAGSLCSWPRMKMIKLSSAPARQPLSPQLLPAALHQPASSESRPSRRAARPVVQPGTPGICSSLHPAGTHGSMLMQCLMLRLSKQLPWHQQQLPCSKSVSPCMKAAWCAMSVTPAWCAVSAIPAKRLLPHYQAGILEPLEDAHAVQRTAAASL